MCKVCRRPDRWSEQWNGDTGYCRCVAGPADDVTMIHLRVGKRPVALHQGYQRSYDQGQCDRLDQCEPLQSWLSGRADPCDANLAVPTACAGRSFRMMGGSDGFAGTDKSRQLR